MTAKEGIDYVITTNDSYNRYRFDISIMSLTSRDLCLYRNQWPSIDTYVKHRIAGEMIHQLDAEIAVRSTSSTYLPRTSTVGGHCVSESIEQVQQLCSERLKPDQELKTSLPYRYFDLSILQDTDNLKTLEYKVDIDFCEIFK